MAEKRIVTVIAMDLLRADFFACAMEGGFLLLIYSTLCFVCFFASYTAFSQRTGRVFLWKKVRACRRTAGAINMRGESNGGNEGII